MNSNISSIRNAILDVIADVTKAMQTITDGVLYHSAVEALGSLYQAVCLLEKFKVQINRVNAGCYLTHAWGCLMTSQLFALSRRVDEIDRVLDIYDDDHKERR